MTLPEASTLLHWRSLSRRAEARLVSCGALVDSVWTHGGWYIS